MIRKIDEQRCNGCGLCVEACPMDVLRLEEKDGVEVAVIRYPQDCMSCFNCEQDCPEEGTIYVDPERARHIPLPW